MSDKSGFAENIDNTVLICIIKKYCTDRFKGVKYVKTDKDIGKSGCYSRWKDPCGKVE